MRSPFLAAALILVLGACSTTDGSLRATPKGPWIQPSVDFQRQIDQHAARLPYLQKLDDFVEEIHWFIGAGEPAYATLLELAAGEDSKVAGTALAAIGGSNDSRLVPMLEQIPWPRVAEQRLRYERARCHMKLGDWSHVEELIGGLGDEDLYARSLCFKALREGTGETFDYHPKASAEEREASLARWREWSTRIAADSLQKR